MIARGGPISAVCLRCRLRLLRQPTPIRYVTSDAFSTPTTATTTAAAAAADDGAGSRIDDAYVARDADQASSSKAGDRERMGYRKLKFRKGHLSGNRILKETAVRLDSEMLGKPAYVIVMRDGGNVQKKEIPSDSVEGESDHKSEVAIIEDLVESQRQPVAHEDVMLGIHGLQPQGDKNLLEKDFRKLQRLLHDGFKNTQLAEYFGWHRQWRKSDAEREALEATSSPEFPWILHRHPWVPLTKLASEEERRLLSNQIPSQDLLLDYVSETDPPKQKLVVHLMRTCWGLSIAELQNELGEIQIKVRAREFSLLMRGQQRFMKTLAKTWLQPGQKIEAVRSQNTLRLITTPATAELLIRDLDETLGNVRTRTFPVTLVGSEAPDEAILEELGRITNTHIRTSHTSRRLHVTWIEVKSRTARGLTGLEDLAHVVLRLLLTASGSPRTTSTILSPIISGVRSGRLIVDPTCKNKLQWKDRLAQWARFVHPLTAKESITNSSLPVKEFELPFEPLERTESLKEEYESFHETKFPLHGVKWTNVLRTSTVACFGQVLHPFHSTNPTPLLSDLLVSADRRIFVPTTIHPLYLSKFEDSETRPLVNMKTTVVLRFWPSPSSNPESKPSSKASAGDTPPAPILELRLAVSETEVLGIESLRAITRTHHTDVLLPSSLVDVRFTQTQHETLRGADEQALATWQPLADFFEHARIDLEKGKLEMPPRHRFPIPRRLLASEPSPPSAMTDPSEESTDSTDLPKPVFNVKTLRQHKKGKPKKDSDDLVSVSYEFVGLEFHRSATIPYKGHQLTYTSIEAGQGGGRRVEVTLEPTGSPHSTTSTTGAVDDGTLQENFLECCSKMVADRTLWFGNDPKR